MREVWAKPDSESLFRFGFPYPGELSYGWRTGLLDTGVLMRVVDGLVRRDLPLVPEESEISLLLSADVESAEQLAGDLRTYEVAESGDVWQYYVAIAVMESIADLSVRFDLLYSAWADLGYPEGMRSVVYPEGDMPAHLDVGAGSVALARFTDEWQKKLSGREPGQRVLCG